MLKRALTFGPAAMVLLLGLSIGVKYDRFVLPAFDGNVYDAMAESPRFFTLAPWGYRVLEPWIVHVLPVASFAEGFFWLNLVLLAATCLVLGDWLRRIGFGAIAAAVGTALFAVSPPVRLLLDYQVLVDPLTLFLLALALRALTEPRTLELAAIFAAMALSKENGLLALVLLPFALTPRDGLVRGLLRSALIALPAVALATTLRLTWGSPAPLTALSVPTLIDRVTLSGTSIAVAAALSGLVVPAVAGLFRETSLEIRAFGVSMWFLTFGAIVANPYDFSAQDLPRLAAFAWPALLPVALSGLGFRRSPPPLTKARSISPLDAGLSVSAIGVCAFMVISVDAYERLPFEKNPDPIAVTARLRESLKTARLLDQGETFAFDARSGRFSEPVEQRFNLTDGRRQRWFLYQGFGPDAAFGSGAPEFRHNAELILPVLTPRDVTMTFEVEGTGYAPVFMNHRQVGSILGGKGLQTFVVAAAEFRRGDNIVRLETYTEDALRLLRWEVSPTGSRH